MDRIQTRAWVNSVLATGLKPAEWTKAAGFTRPNFMYNYLKKDDAGLDHDTQKALVSALRVLSKHRPHLLALLPADKGETRPLTAADEMAEFHRLIYAACEKLSPEAKSRIDIEGVCNTMRTYWKASTDQTSSLKKSTIA